MKKIKVYAFTSLDGYISTIDGDIDWMIGYGRDQDYGFRKFRDTVDTVLCNEAHYLNLQSYDIHWPYDGLQSYILTPEPFTVPEGRSVHFLKEHEGDSLCIPLSQLQDISGQKDVWLAGDHSLITMMMDHDQVDEIISVVLPVTLGAGHILPIERTEDFRWRNDGPICYTDGVRVTKYIKEII